MNIRNISLNKLLVSIPKKSILLISGLLLWSSLSAQVELNPDGIIFPRLDSLGVNSPINGTVIYDTASAQLIYYNGSKWITVGGPFERVGTLVKQRAGQDTDDFIFGRDALPENGENVDETFFFFDKSKNAFRGGRVNSTNWSPDSIGINSFAYGESVKATGYAAIALGTGVSSSGKMGATALGYLTEANGDFGATALGYFSKASGEIGATALGYNAVAFGDGGATALGYSTIATGNSGATALGNSSNASGNSGATALGYNTEASGDLGATAMGYYTVASGRSGAIAMGYLSNASGVSGATALGYNTEASGDLGATALGNSTIATGNSGATALGFLSTASGESGATALGYNSVASGNFGATALGFYAEASGMDGAISLGVSTLASGNNGAIAIGNGTQALGDDGSMALGVGTIATGNSCTVVGLYNDTIVTTGSVVNPTSPIFIVGNGTAGVGNESNAIVVRKDGNVSIGNANPLVRLQVGSNGDGTVARANAWNLFSDRRYKKDVKIIYNSLLKINGLQGRQFTWKESGKVDIGFIAQEVEEIVPVIVSTDSDGFKSLDYSKVVPILVEAIKELTTQVEEQKKNAIRQEARISALQRQIDQLAKGE